MSSGVQALERQAETAAGVPAGQGEEGWPLLLPRIC